MTIRKWNIHKVAFRKIVVITQDFFSNGRVKNGVGNCCRSYRNCRSKASIHGPDFFDPVRAGYRGIGFCVRFSILRPLKDPLPMPQSIESKAKLCAKRRRDFGLGD
jgi:hypothetical protein